MTERSSSWAAERVALVRPELLTLGVSMAATISAGRDSRAAKSVSFQMAAVFDAIRLAIAP
jgi:hypothetical protein